MADLTGNTLAIDIEDFRLDHVALLELLDRFLSGFAPDRKR